MDKLLETKGLVKNYATDIETLNILKNINFSLDYGEKTSVTGESGSGKSTFLNLVGGLDRASGGTILFENKDITGMNEDQLTFYRNKKIGFIFQDHYLLEEFSALENVYIPLLVNDFDIKKASDKAFELLKAVGMENRIKHHPSQLSGGEKQRVAIARSFINDPLIILADEPTGNLDEKNSEIVLELLFNITDKKKHALIIVSHSSRAVKMTNKSYRLINGEFIIN